MCNFYFSLSLNIAAQFASLRDVLFIHKKKHVWQMWKGDVVAFCGILFNHECCEKSEYLIKLSDHLYSST